jgi:hypothetical protein
VLTAWCDVCNLDAELFERWAVLARRTDGPIPSWFESWLEAEGKAHALKIWQPLIIPGLFQTGEYARALFLAAGTDTERAFTSTEVVYGVADPGVTGLPESGVSP